MSCITVLLYVMEDEGAGWDRKSLENHEPTNMSQPNPPPPLLKSLPMLLTVLIGICSRVTDFGNTIRIVHYFYCNSVTSAS